MKTSAHAIKKSAFSAIIGFLLVIKQQLIH